MVLNIKDLYYMIPYDYRIGNIWRSFKDWAWNRYTTIKPRQLGHGWHDRSHLMYYMMFEILSQFIEKECSPGMIDWYNEGCIESHSIVVNGEKKWVRDEMQDIYNWWHNKYLKEYEDIEKELNNKMDKLTDRDVFNEDNPVYEDGRLCGYEWKPVYKDGYKEVQKKLRELEAQREKELQDNLHRLINIRDHMWT